MSGLGFRPVERGCRVGALDLTGILSRASRSPQLKVLPPIQQPAAASYAEGRVCWCAHDITARLCVLTTATFVSFCKERRPVQTCTYVPLRADPYIPCYELTWFCVLPPGGLLAGESVTNVQTRLQTSAAGLQGASRPTVCKTSGPALTPAALEQPETLAPAALCQ